MTLFISETFMGVATPSQVLLGAGCAQHRLCPAGDTFTGIHTTAFKQVIWFKPGAWVGRTGLLIDLNGDLRPLIGRLIQVTFKKFKIWITFHEKTVENQKRYWIQGEKATGIRKISTRMQKHLRTWRFLKSPLNSVLMTSRPSGLTHTLLCANFSLDLPSSAVMLYTMR